MLTAAARVEVGNTIQARLSEARQRTDELFRIVRSEALYDRPIAERHRVVFYLGHLEAFDGNLLGDRLFALGPVHPVFDRLFAFGIDPVDGGLPSDKPSDWPSLAEIGGYVSRIRENIDAGIEAVFRSGAPSGGAEGFPADLLLNVAIEHRLMHAETLAYMLHQMPLDRKVPAPPTVHRLVPQVESSMIEIPSGAATLGLARRDAGTFGWDNEYEEHRVSVPAFMVDEHKVTNRQFLEFLNAGGYENRALWSDADWAWKTGQHITHPAFWRKSGANWLQLAMFSEVPFPLDWPVYVSHAEASAYSRWRGKFLPTEAQWHRAAYAASDDDKRPYPWGSDAPSSRHGNFDFRSWDPVAVGSFPGNRSAFGVSDLVGNGWEWTSSRFEAFPGFTPFGFYPGYSANFFDGQHYVMKGGSARTAACMLRRSFRNWFQPHYQYVYAGFRCAGN